jgi:hypothetical protein
MFGGVTESLDVIPSGVRFRNIGPEAVEEMEYVSGMMACPNSRRGRFRGNLPILRIRIVTRDGVAEADSPLQVREADVA